LYLKQLNLSIPSQCWRKNRSVSLFFSVAHLSFPRMILGNPLPHC